MEGFSFFKTRIGKKKAPARKDMPQAVYASLWLNPNLTHEIATRLTKLLAESPKLVFERDEPLIEAGTVPDKVFLVVSGMVRVVRPGSANRPTEVLTHFREGQWLGLPSLLYKALGRHAPEVITHASEKVAYDVRPIGTVEAAAIDIEKILPLLLDEEVGLYFAAQVFHRTRYLDEYVEMIQALARHEPRVNPRLRGRFMRYLHSHPLLSQLEDADLELLIQLIKTHHEHTDSNEAYLKAGQPNGKVAILVNGSAQAYLPSPSGGTFVGTFDPGSLIGFEHIATREELAQQGIRSDWSVIDPLMTPEPPRHTEIHLEPCTAVAEMDWRVLRWMLYEKKHLWARVREYLRPGPVRQPKPPAPVYTFYGLTSTLGTSVLAQGTAIRLTRQIADDEREAEAHEEGHPRDELTPRVCLIDLKDTMELMCDRFQGESALIKEIPEQEGDLVDGDEDNFFYSTRLYHVGQGACLEVAWTKDVEDTDKLIELKRQQGTMETIIVAADIRAIEEMPTLGESWRDGVTPELAVELAHRINRVTDHVVWLTDDPYAGYDITPEVPRSILRAEIMNRAFRARERHRALQVLRTWWQMTPGQGDGLPEMEIGDDNDESMRQLFPKQPMQKARHILRVPHEPEEDTSLYTRDIDETYADKSSDMVQTFERLVRMIQGRTVGVALGGGGAWGFTHVALMRALEANGVPVDYVAGTSFGSVVAGLYGAGGMPALDKLLEWSNSESARTTLENTQASISKSGGISGAFKAFRKTMRDSQLTRRVNKSLLTSRYLQTMIDDMLMETLGNDVIPLTTTPIPFLPITTNVNEGREEIIYHGTVGHGVRSASCLPPVFSPLVTGDERFIDGAMVAFVPAHKVREWGADFVIASNVIPPNADYKSLVDRALGHTSHEDEYRERQDMDRRLKTSLQDALAGKPGAAADYRRLTQAAKSMPQRSAMAMMLMNPLRTTQRVIDDLLIRVLDTIHGFYLMSWKAGEDQGKRHANYILDMRPADFQVFQFWRGNEIVDRYTELFKTERIGEHIRQVWKEPQDWDDMDAHHISVEIVDGIPGD